MFSYGIQNDHDSIDAEVNDYLKIPELRSVDVNMIQGIYILIKHQVKHDRDHQGRLRVLSISPCYLFAKRRVIAGSQGILQSKNSELRLKMQLLLAHEYFASHPQLLILSRDFSRSFHDIVFLKPKLWTSL